MRGFLKKPRCTSWIGSGFLQGNKDMHGCAFKKLQTAFICEYTTDNIFFFPKLCLSNKKITQLICCQGGKRETQTVLVLIEKGMKHELRARGVNMRGRADDWWSTTAPSSYDQFAGIRMCHVMSWRKSRYGRKTARKPSHPAGLNKHALVLLTADELRQGVAALFTHLLL